jgi:hypothetical protein
MIRVDQTPNWDNLIAELQFTDAEKVRFVEVIITGIIDRVKNQKTALGEVLSENSPRWSVTKRNLGKPQLPLQFTGGLTRESTYQLEVTDTGAYIVLIPSYRQIHLDLIEISEATGKNYEDWFGIHEDDIDDVMFVMERIIEQKLGAL